VSCPYGHKHQKEKDQFTWISAMEQIKHTAEEIVLNDLIYKL
jgi:hypothetical protein